MSSRILSVTEIDNRCLSLVNGTLPYYSELAEAFRVLYLSGCRISEIFEIERWEYMYDYTLSLLPQKGNNLRYITLDSTCNNFIAAVVGQYKPFLGRTPGQLDNLLNKVKTWDTFEVGGKKRASYIFRYNFVKQLDTSGFTISEISSVMGYTSTTTPTAYLQAEVVENFTPPPIESVTIGGQTWMSKNLAVDDGGSGIYYPKGDINNVAIYGLLYTWDAAVRVAGLVSGCSLPTSSDFALLSDYLGGDTVAGGKLKESGTIHWLSPNSGATNESGFTALPAGGRYVDGSFSAVGAGCTFWSATAYNASNAWYLSLSYNNFKAVRSYYGKFNAYSIRLLVT